MTRVRSIVALTMAAVLVSLFTLDAVAGSPEIDAQVRIRESVLMNQNFSSDDDMSSFAVMRTRLGFGFEANERTSGYLQFQDTRAFGEPANTLTLLEQVDLHQGYVLVKNVFDQPAALRLGRQEMNYFRQRQVGAVGWSDIGRSFDGARVEVDFEDSGWLHAFAMKTNETGANTPGPGSNAAAGNTRETAFLGGYLHLDLAEGTQAEVYLFDFMIDDGDMPVEDNTGNLFTVGGTFQFDAKDAGLTLYGEGAMQFGSTPDMVAADDAVDFAGWAAYAGATYEIPSENLSPFIGVEVNMASGDDGSDDGETNDYQQLFPTAHAPLGYMDLVSWSNILEYNARLGIKPNAQWMAYADFHVFQVMEEAGNWYGLGGPLFGGARLTGDAGFDSALGQELDLVVKYTVDSSLSFLAKFGLWMPGDWQNQATALAGGEADPVANPADLDSRSTLWLQTTANF